MLQPIMSISLLCLQGSSTLSRCLGAAAAWSWPVSMFMGSLALNKLPSVPAGVCCLKHDIWGEFDELTDVARFHRHPRKKGPIVPSFIFFVEGALVGLTCMTHPEPVAFPVASCCGCLLDMQHSDVVSSIADCSASLCTEIVIAESCCPACCRYSECACQT